ncbi:hypothetical protein BKA67DRAFT_696274 [Truncatella angustata]|uniref:Uncharacterized protein n=1 Tax=Truncatella angustata TaxID=152316 RepID=A0A9P8UCX9_9PEZI|nr:uncharacterized protein BKA67DRAFT_696274 [Truncatella angustata]KAH6646417.1 hypothetical protein BKA67DRAFT_696274 [Truncatella angustata]
MPFNQHHHHRPSAFAAGEPPDNQLPSNPMDAEFSIAPAPMDSVFPQRSASSCSSSPMDVSFPDPFPSECSTAAPLSPVLSPTTTTSSTAITTTAFPTTAASTFASAATSTWTSSSPPQPAAARLPQPCQAFSAHRRQRQQPDNPLLAKKLREMALPLAPLVQLTTGRVHPAFPGTLLGFWLLTEGELEGLAHFYHQRTPCRWTSHYPCPVAWDPAAGTEEKRRRIGRFIGLRGCETPPPPVAQSTEEEILDEARRARKREEEEEVWRRKLPWY